MSIPDVPKKLSVAIVGAGLGGLLLALVLQKDSPDIEVNIYEAHHELTEVGAGIGVWPRIWEILRYVGLEDTLKQSAGAAPQPIRFSKADEPTAVDFYEFTPSLYTFHRSQLLKLLGAHIRDPECVLHFSKRLETYADGDPADGPVTLHFKDGSSATCDVLVGSDGIRSTVRREMYARLAEEAGREGGEGEGEGEGGGREKAEEMCAMVEPVWSGWVANRGLIPTAMLGEEVKKRVEVPTIFIGKDKNVVCYPIAQGKMLNVAAFVLTPGSEGEQTTYDGPWVAATSGEDVARQFSTWDKDIQSILKSMQTPNLWAIHTVRELPTYVHGRAALLGDAAHAMTTFQASGAGQAIEDGFVLAAALRVAVPGTTRGVLAAALRAYDAVRRPRAQAVQRRSRANGELSHLRAGAWAGVSAETSAAGGFEREKLVQVGEEIARMMDWAVDGSVMEDRERVVEIVRGLVGSV